MTTTAIRKKLHEFIAEAPDSKVKGMFLLLEDEISKKGEFSLTSKHMDILEEERMKHENGTSKSYSWDEAKELIRDNNKIY